MLAERARKIDLNQDQSGRCSLNARSSGTTRLTSAPENRTDTGCVTPRYQTNCYSLFFANNLPGFSEHRVEHGASEKTCLGVPLARMVRPNQGNAPR